MLGQRPHVLTNVAPHAAILRHSSAGKRRGRHLLSGASQLTFVTVRAFLATWGPYAVGYCSPCSRRRFCRKSRGRCGSATAETQIPKQLKRDPLGGDK